MAWKKRPGERLRRDWYASLDGLTWVHWPKAPTDSEASKVEHKLVYEPIISPVETKRTSDLRSLGFQVVPPK